ncbi:Serine/threonine-protein phosphatase 7 [Hordeum vulgare]|nr:Serine/threonine-protein phosphatase 7 [Hordeum vulgare]
MVLVNTDGEVTEKNGGEEAVEVAEEVSVAGAMEESEPGDEEVLGAEEEGWAMAGPVTDLYKNVNLLWRCWPCAQRHSTVAFLAVGNASPCGVAGLRMFQPDKYPCLDEFYEQKHRVVLVERGEVPPVLRLRGHNPNESLLYDPRYEPYFRRMDLLQFVLNFNGTPPWLNATALTALTDRWRPETHSFHLPLGEMTITLEDIAMITGLPIEGRALTGKVNWRPYTVLRQFPLSNMCLRDQHLWRVWCPMICFFAVEWHLPHRVSKKFGVQQRTRPDYVETSVQLHNIELLLCTTNRQTNKSVINWEEHHMIWVDMWNAQRHARVENDQTPDTDEAAYLRHLEWMRTEYKVIHKGAWTRSDCLDLLPSEAADAAFNNSIRETVGAHLDYGPLHDRVGTKLWRCINDSNVALGRAPSSQTDEFVRTTLQKVANRCRTLAALLFCHGVSSTDVRARAQYRMDVQSSARPSASRPRASSARLSSSRARASSSGAHVEEFEEEEESDNEAADPDFIEFGAIISVPLYLPVKNVPSIDKTGRQCSKAATHGPNVQKA